LLDTFPASIYTGITLYERIHRMEMTMQVAVYAKSKHFSNNGKWHVIEKSHGVFVSLCTGKPISNYGIHISPNRPRHICKRCAKSSRWDTENSAIKLNLHVPA